MSNSLTVASLTNLPTTQNTVDLSRYGSGGDYLGRLQLISPQSKYAARGKIPAGHFGIPGSDEEIEDLGDTVDVIVLSVRDKAMDVSGETPIAVFDVNDPLFQDIVDRSDVKDSGCMFGPSFLVYERNSERFLELYLGNKSGRYIAKGMEEFLPINEAQAEQFGIEPRGPQTCTLGAQFMERPNSCWYAPTVGKCSTPFEVVPDADEIVAQVTKFVTEKSSDSAPEVVTTGTGTTRTR